RWSRCGSGSGRWGDGVSDSRCVSSDTAKTERSDGMPLDAQTRALLDEMEAAQAPPLNTLPPEAAREMMFELAKLGGTPDPITHRRDDTVPGPAGDIPIRIYTPAGDGPFPVLVYFHGGGWVIGNCDTHDVPCSNLASRAGCVVVSVDYRLAPEHKFPAAP